MFIYLGTCQRPLDVFNQSINQSFNLLNEIWALADIVHCFDVRIYCLELTIFWCIENYLIPEDVLKICEYVLSKTLMMLLIMNFCAGHVDLD